MADDWMLEADKSMKGDISAPELPQADSWMLEADKYYRKRQKRNASANVGQAVWGNPDQFAKIREAAQKVDAPWQLGERKPQEIEAEAKRIEVLKALKGTDYVQKAFEDPEFAQLAHDDVEQLGLLERSIQLFKKGYYNRQAEKSLADVVTDLQKAKIKRRPSYPGHMRREFAGMAYDPERAREIEAGISFEGYKEALKKAQAIPESPTLMRMMEQPTFGEAFKVFTDEPINTTVDAIASSGYAMLETMLGGLVGGVMGPWGVASGIGLQSFAVNYDSKFREALSQKGVNINDPTALMDALNNMELMTEVANKSFRYALPISIFDAAAGRLASVSMAPSKIANTTAQMGTQAGLGAGGEAVGQVAAEGEIESPGEVLIEGLAEIPGGVFEQFMATGKYVRSAADSVEGQVLKRRVDEMAEIAANSKLLERAPDKFGDLVNRMLGEDADALVYIDANEFVEYFQNQNVDPLEVAEQLEGVAEQLPQATALKGDIAIKASDYITQLGPTEYHQGLSEMLRTDPAGMSMRDQQTWEKTKAAQLKEDVDRIMAEQAENQEFQASADRVQEAVRVELAQQFPPEIADRYAALHRAFSTVMADRLNIKPEEVYARRGLKITTEAAPVTYEQPFYHGTPFKFSEFDLSKVGTGEGAQAFGYGIYFAEVKGIAESYKQEISEQQPIQHYFIGDEEIDMEAADIPTVRALNMLIAEKNDLQRAIERIEAGNKILDKKYRWEVEPIVKRMKEILEQGGARYEEETPGHVYEVEIADETVAKMLNWDLPLEDQPASVKQAIKKVLAQYPDQFGIKKGIRLGKPQPRYEKGSYPERKFGQEYVVKATHKGTEYTLGQKAKTPEEAMRQARVWVSEQGEIDWTQTGKEFYRGMAPYAGMGREGFREQAVVSDILKNAGIPGIRYFDAVSRARGEGTRNVVIFDPALAKITKIDDQPVQALEDITLTEEVEVTETGERVTVEQNAQEALNSVDERLENLRKLVDCVAA